MPQRLLFAALTALLLFMAPSPASAQGLGACGQVPLCETACAEGESQACAALSRAYSEGTSGVDADVTRATAYGQRACELGDGETCHRLGRAYEQGGLGGDRGSAQASLKQAEVFYGRACSAGINRACGEQARLLLYGSGGRADPRSAVALFAKGCAGRDGGACEVLAALHTVGYAVPRDAAKASMYARQAGGEALTPPALPDASAAVLNITSEPPGVPVLVDGMLAGPAPVTVRVPAGLHHVEVRHKSGSKSQSVTVARGSQQRVVISYPAMLELTGAPEGASVAIDGEPRGSLPFKGEVSPGQHEIFVQAEGHSPRSLRVSLLPGTTTHEKVTLALQPSRLKVESTPPGATVKVDGKSVGVTPFEGDVTTGPHTLEVELAGHLAQRESLPASRAGQLVQKRFTLVPQPVPFQLTSEPAGAEVWVDGRKIGVTPFKGTLPPGPRRVELRQQGYDPIVSTVQVAAGKAVTQTQRLALSPVRVEIDSEPRGADVRIGGKSVGRTRWTGALPPGMHTVEISQNGYAPTTQRIVLAPGQREWKAAPKLVAKPVRLQIESEPKGAELHVDGKRVGVTPHVGTILPGRHKVSLRLSGYAQQDFELEVHAARDVREQRRLDAAPVTAEITSVPVGAQLKVDGKRLGKTPWRGTLRAGKQPLELELDGYRTYKQELVVAPGARVVTLAPTLVAVDSQVELDSEPRGAEVWIGDKRLGKTPLRTKLAPGTHRIEYRLEGHQTQQANVVAAAGKPVVDRRTLVQTPVPVEFSSTPAGASVILDGKAVGKTPWKGGIAPGRREVVISLDGYEDARESVTLAPGTVPLRKSFTLRGAPIAMRVESTPAGASVKVDGRQVGVTPWKGTVPARGLKLELGKDGYREVSRDVVPAAGKEVIERHTLVPSPSTLRLLSEPPGARITLDGKALGRTPWEGEVAAGTHAIELEAPHHAPWSGQLTIEPAKKVERRIELEPQPVSLMVEAQPLRAEVYVDGERRGTTPLRLSVRPGRREVEVRAPGHSPKGEVIALAPGAAEVRRSYMLEVAEVPLSVTTAPVRASVWVDGARVGTAPWTGNVSAGSHEVRATAPGYQDAVTRVEPTEGRAGLSASLTLVPAPVSVEIRTEPSGARVTIDGAARGTSPLTVQLAPGEHTLALEAEGYAKVTTARVLEPAERAKWTFDLQATPVDVALVLRPATAKLTVDGKPYEGAAKTLSLLPGKHQLEARLEGHTTLERELTVTREPGQKVELVLVPTLDGPLPAHAMADPNDLASRDPASLRATLADPRASRTDKVVAMQRLAPQVTALGPELALTTKDVRGELCLAWAAHFAQTWLTVEAVDDFGAPVAVTASVHGQELGQTPLRVKVPVCVEQVTTGVQGKGRHAAHPVKLTTGKETFVTLRLPGRGDLHVVSLYGEAGQTLQDYGDGMQTLVASGLRWEYFGRILHLQLGVKGFMRGASVSGLGEVERYPLVDATVGLAGVIGNDAMRVHLGLGVGVWSLVVPTARASLGFNFADRLYLGVEGQLHVAHPGLLPDGMRQSRYQGVPFEAFVYPSAGLSLGWIFR